MLKQILPLLLFLSLFNQGFSQPDQPVTLENDKARFELLVQDGKILRETFSLTGEGQATVTSDGDFNILMVWTGWRAPGKENNGDVKVSFGKKDFKIISHEQSESDDGRKYLTLELEGINSSLFLSVQYALGANDTYFRKRLILSDTLRETHFLRKLSPVESKFKDIASVTKDGGFGQPVALQLSHGSAFIGLEYPASEQRVEGFHGEVKVYASQYIGSVVKSDGVASDWAVIGLAKEPHIKRAFMDYLDDIRVSPAEPYTLYNSWYDLRSTEYPGVPEENKMNQGNVLRIIDLIRENMIEKHGIRLDAFVLDDGWDVYESDWVLREEEFPEGLSPVAAKLSETNTDLGIWFGPTGGYSFRMKRIDWMREHGYETVGQEKTGHSEMMCLAGSNYSDLFRKRVVDMVEDQGVRYFKWDGIQFSCSEPDHGHATGIYSRDAVLGSLLEQCEAVREADPDVYLNVTSGTWLSPWWLKYTNQIWMDGGDYGWASVPSFSKRDAAITYRDQVLYEDFHKKNLWFPISNLMTHGIIKGNLQKLGGEAEPIDKFTDNALLYFARGVSMWELYISPDILNEDEWNAIAESIHWARDRFEILSGTYMIGGDPSEREPYGYVHFKGSRGIVALRNPSFEPTELSFKLSAEYGLKEQASSLVLHQVYPFQWISPELYSEGGEVTIPLNGYETAVFEIYDLESTDVPLLANVIFDQSVKGDKELNYKLYEACGPLKLLNPEDVTGINGSGEIASLSNLPDIAPANDLLSDQDVVLETKKGSTVVKVDFRISEEVVAGTLGLLFEPGFSNEIDDAISAELNGMEVQPGINRQQDKWVWMTFPVEQGHNEIRVKLNDFMKEDVGCQAWLFAMQKRDPVELKIVSREKIHLKPMPPSPVPDDVFKSNVKIGEARTGR